jgi:hypothetical protein
MNTMDIVRNRILDREEENVLDLLGGLRFGFEIDGQWYDPWQLTEEQRLAWMQQVYDAMSDIREEGRLVDFTQKWAGLDKEHRDHLLDQNSHLFARSRANAMKSMSDADCAWLADADNWQVVDFLTDNGPGFAPRMPVDGAMLANRGAEMRAPAPSLAMAA